ncbi:hypothetical protein CYPRO_0337 [Cyclonatronum proteinivorum]|uniref:Uncharacterized protein n=1 Tax=Cyclonatronum proteinivorum TaxID=1457365 RepID=A0A345UGM3_9BACT|nr:hypothetical protein CYPRO_0337 [Cyclonatronum proteinivorum]
MPRTKKTRIPPQSSSQPYGRTLVVAQRSPEQGKAPRPNRDVKKVPGIPRNRRRQQYGRTLVVAQRSPELGTVSCRDRRAMCVQVHVTNPIFSNDILSGVSDGHIMPAAFPNGGGRFFYPQGVPTGRCLENGVLFQSAMPEYSAQIRPNPENPCVVISMFMSGMEGFAILPKSKGFRVDLGFLPSTKDRDALGVSSKKHRRNYSVARFQAGFFFG